MADQFDLPFQRHSKTSRGGARRPSRARVTAQEQWVYETLQQISLADFQTWERVQRERPQLFDKLSSVQRARVGLVWVNRQRGVTPYHPVEDSGQVILNPRTGVECAIWQMKLMYRTMPYETWVERYKALAHERRT
jgi:hypothetical protein